MCCTVLIWPLKFKTLCLENKFLFSLFHSLLQLRSLHQISVKEENQCMDIPQAWPVIWCSSSWYQPIKHHKAISLSSWMWTLSLLISSLCNYHPTIHQKCYPQSIHLDLLIIKRWQKYCTTDEEPWALTTGEPLQTRPWLCSADHGDDSRGHPCDMNPWNTESQSAYEGGK